MDPRVFEMQANLCKVFSHPKRLQILCLLKDGEKSFSELQEATELSKANLSQHLTILRERDVLLARRDGQQLFLSVANPKITAACELMHEVLCEQIQERRQATGV
ncbi:metalloregulator ArsR/SmtB family transcription factor [bacterium]|nr:metalloregulator ArsR/SmtB family transcription factor [bacterium]